MSLASALADYVVAVGLDGHVTGEESIASALQHDSKLAVEVANEEELEKEDINVDDELAYWATKYRKDLTLMRQAANSVVYTFNVFQ